MLQKQCLVKRCDKTTTLPLITSGKQSTGEYRDHLQLSPTLERISRGCHVRSSCSSLPAISGRSCRYQRPKSAAVAFSLYGMRTSMISVALAGGLLQADYLDVEQIRYFNIKFGLYIYFDIKSIFNFAHVCYNTVYKWFNRTCMFLNLNEICYLI